MERRESKSKERNSAKSVVNLLCNIMWAPLLWGIVDGGGGQYFKEDYKKGQPGEYGFTEERAIQDFPIRGKAVYLHVRRRKWRDTEDGSIFTYNYELTEEGSRLTP